MAPSFIQIGCLEIVLSLGVIKVENLCRILMPTIISNNVQWATSLMGNVLSSRCFALERQ